MSENTKFAEQDIYVYDSVEAFEAAEAAPDAKANKKAKNKSAAQDEVYFYEPEAPAEISGFDVFELPNALSRSLAHLKYTSPTPVQAQAIPAAMKGKDILGSAQTGTGKTGAFCIPIIAKLMMDTHAGAVIMAPTRELAAQILTVARGMIHTNSTIKTALLIGGEAIGKQYAQLRTNPRLIIGTPGRINDHLRSNPALFRNMNIVVLDEADRMLDMGFAPQIDEVLKTVPAKHQTLMFSATFAPAIIKFAQKYLNDPIRISIAPEQRSAENIEHETIFASDNERYGHLVEQLHKREGSVVLFMKTKYGAERMAGRLQDGGHNAIAIHGGLNQRQRDRAIAGFRAKKTRIMVATDVAARGLDVPHVEHVINYDLPQVAEDYVHRIGRTARAGAKGHALSIVMPADKGKWAAIQRILNPGAQPARGERSERGNGGFRDRPNRSNNSDGGRFERKDRPSYGQRSERPAYGERAERPAFGERKPRPFGERAERGFDGERKARPFNGERSERPAFGERKPRPFGERSERGFDGERKARPFNGERSERPAFGERKPRPFGERAERGFDGERKARPFSNERNREGDTGAAKPFGKKPWKSNDGQKPAGARPGKPYAKPFGKPAAGNKPYKKRSFSK